MNFNRNWYKLSSSQAFFALAGELIRKGYENSQARYMAKKMLKDNPQWAGIIERGELDADTLDGFLMLSGLFRV